MTFQPSQQAPEREVPPAFDQGRRAVQIAVGRGHGSVPMLYVLASDGTIWALGSTSRSWQQIPF